MMSKKQTGMVVDEVAQGINDQCDAPKCNHPQSTSSDGVLTLICSLL